MKKHADFNSRSTIWHGCSPEIAQAIQLLTERWESYTVRSRKFPLYRLFGEVVGPSWKKYCDSLPPSLATYRHAAKLNLKSIGPKLGFTGLRRQLEKLVKDHYLLDQGTGQDKRTRQRPQHSNTSQSRSLKLTRSYVFAQTLETLIELADRCSAKLSSAANPDDGVNALRGKEFCALCGKPSEIRAYAASDARTKERLWPHERGSLILNLSSKYCSSHRPKNHDGTWNPEYKRAKRTSSNFEIEAERLTQQSTSLSKRKANSGNLVVDDFYLGIISQKMLYPDEQAELRNHARRLVQHRMTDLKKFVLTMRSAGYTQQEIGKRCGLSQQAISKTLKSIPLAYLPSS